MAHVDIREQPNCRAGIGRVKGSKNLLTQALKEKIAMLANEEIEKVAETMDIVRKKSPTNYVKLVLKMAELVLPKKQEVELTNEDSIDIHATLEDIRSKINSEKE